MDTPQTIAAEQHDRLHFVIIGTVVLAVVAIGIAILAGLVYLLGDEVGMPVVVTQEDDGTTMGMVSGAEVLVTLDSNPTTGYEWAIDTLDADVVEFLGSTYAAPEHGAVGQGGTQELRFRALADGTATLTLKYWRPWEGDTSVTDRFQMMFEVRD